MRASHPWETGPIGRALSPVPWGELRPPPVLERRSGAGNSELYVGRLRGSNHRNARSGCWVLDLVQEEDLFRHWHLTEADNMGVG